MLFFALYRDAVCGILRPAVNTVKILLRGGDVLVAGKILHGIDIRACVELERAEGVAA